MAGKLRLTLQLAILSAVLLVVVIGAGEVTIALLMRFPWLAPPAIGAQLRNYYWAADFRVIQFKPECGRYDPGLTYIYRPGRCRFTSHEFDTLLDINSLGVRDDEDSLVAPDVVVVGDSIALGWGVNEGENFSDVIEKRTGLKVLNLGIGSYGTVRELEILKRVDLSNMRLLILQYTGNDLRENKTFAEHGNKLPILTEAEFIAARDRHLATTRYYFGKHSLWFGGVILRRLLQGRQPAPVSEPDVEARFFANAFLAKLKELDLEARRNLPPFPVILFGETWPPEIGDAALATAGGLPASVSRVIHVNYPPGEDLYFPLDRHPTAAGHAGIANELIAAMKDLDLR
jgi:hypothetical protein